MDADSSTIDTIIAIASPPGRSVRGIVRISGPRTRQTLDAFSLRLRNGQPAEFRRGVWPCHIFPAGFAAQIPAIALFFRGPASYTGEDGAELILPGHPDLLRRVVDAAAAIPGVRRAEPGEFSTRAYLAGRLSLGEAEGVAATIAATQASELEAAQLLANESLPRAGDRAAKIVAAALALVEAGIDFTDQEDVTAIGAGDLRMRLESATAELDRVVGRASLESGRSDSGRACIGDDDQPWVVLIGASNAGKSTLFNRLLGHDRTVTSPVAGATRDLIVEPVKFEGLDVILADSVGVDPESVRHSRIDFFTTTESKDRADLLLVCVPSHRPVEAIPGDVDPNRIVIVRTFADRPDHESIDPRIGDIAVSGLEGDGISELRSLIVDRLRSMAESRVAGRLTLLPRYTEAIVNARRAIDGVIATTAAMPASELHDSELIAAELRLALDALGQLGGDVSPDDILGRIFSSFCIGK